MTVDLTLNKMDQDISHIWRTSIQENVEGDEKRSALFTWPRLEIDNNIKLVSDEENRFINTHLYRSIFDLWKIPIMFNRTTLTGQATAGQKVLTIADTSNRHFYDGRELLLKNPNDWEDYEICTIDAVDSDIQITALVNLGNTWPIGTLVYPIYECTISKEQTVSVVYKTFSKFKILANESFLSLRDFSYIIPTINTTKYPVYNSLNLFLLPPLYPLDGYYNHPYVLFGSLGLKKGYSTYENAKNRLDRTFFGNDIEEIQDLLDFFDVQQGRYGSFYTPTWLDDFKVSDGFLLTDQTIDVKEIYRTSIEIVGKHVYIQFPNKSYVCREITARPTSTSITLNSAIGTTVALADVEGVLISFLPEVRFDQDEIKLKFFKETMAKIDLRFTVL